MNKLSLPLFCLSAILASSAGLAQGQMPSKVQAAIIYKILKYDKNAASRSNGSVNIVIIVEGAAEKRKAELVSGFSSINGQSVDNATIKIAAVTVTGPSNLAAAMKATAGNILYLPQGISAETAAAAIAYAKTNKAPVFSDNPALATQGAAVCLVLEGNSPKMVINLPASQAQGMALSADVLRLAKVIR